MRTALQVAVIAAAVLIVPTTALAQGCAWCTTPTKCELIDQSARDTCSVDAEEGCQLGTGICIIARATIENDFVGAEIEFRPANTRYGEIQVVAVDTNRFIAWDCLGDPVVLMSVSAHGTLEDLPLDSVPDDFTYAAFSERQRTMIAKR